MATTRFDDATPSVFLPSVDSSRRNTQDRSAGFSHLSFKEHIIVHGPLDPELLYDVAKKMVDRTVAFYEKKKFDSSSVYNLNSVHDLLAMIATQDNIREATLYKIYEACLNALKFLKMDQTHMLEALMKHPRTPDHLKMRILDDFGLTHVYKLLWSKNTGIEVLEAIMVELGKTGINDSYVYREVHGHPNATNDLKFRICLKLLPLVSDKNYAGIVAEDDLTLFYAPGFDFDDELRTNIFVGMRELGVNTSLPFSYVVTALWDNEELLGYVKAKGFDYDWLYTFIT